MRINTVFVGQAEKLAELYEGIGKFSFALDTGGGLVLPGIGDHVTLRMHPGPDIRRFRCTGRHFDFSEVGSPALVLSLDMP